MFSIIHGQIYSKDFSKLEKLAADYNSCVRWAYVRFMRNGSEFNEVRVQAKAKYTALSTRQISDAVAAAQTLARRSHKGPIVFGGKRLWKKLQSGHATLQQWRDARDAKYAARGDKTRFGNPNLRVVGDHLRVTVGPRQFESYKLFIPAKFKERLRSLIDSGEAYNVKLTKQDATHWQVTIGYQVVLPDTTITCESGALGVDINVDRLAITEITADGNFVAATTLIEPRLQAGSSEKRAYDIGCLVNTVISMARSKQKGIVCERLQFRQQPTKSKRVNRIRSNFVWRKILDALQRKCAQNGIECRQVNPAFTSIIGGLKYREMLNITRHESAAFVIARRGMGFNEKLSVYRRDAKQVKQQTLGTLGEKYRGKRIHSWALWRNVEAVPTGLRNRMRDLEELRDCVRDGSENLPGKDFLLELVGGSGCNNNVGRRKTTLPE